MDAELLPLDPLLQQWRALPAGDRKGILRRLPVEQRLTFQRILDASERAIAEATARPQRFSGYSAWLGELLDACEKEAPAAAGLKPAVRAALLAGHELAAESTGEPESALSLAGLAHSLLKAARSRL